MSPSDISIADPDRAAAARTHPLVWVLQSYRAGENTQLLGLAELLGVPFMPLAVRYRRIASLPALLRRTSLAGIDADSRALIRAPWPDLLISAGLRNEPLAAYVRRASGGRTRVVFIGRTWRSLDAIDLLVTTPQYRVPAGPRVLTNLLTQHRVSAARLARAAAAHAELLERLPRPLTGVLLGGSSGPYVLGTAAADTLAAMLRERVRAHGGSVLVSSSARTPAAFLDRLARGIDGLGEVYRYRPDDPANPYYAMLACADALVVTGDSVAMLSEAAAAGKPVLIFDISVDTGGDVTWGARAYRLMMRLLPARLTRDVALFHRSFVAAGFGTLLNASRPGRERPAAALPAAAAADRRGADPSGETRRRVLGLLDTEPGRDQEAAAGLPSATVGAPGAGAAASPTRPRSIR